VERRFGKHGLARKQRILYPFRDFYRPRVVSIIAIPKSDMKPVSAIPFMTA